MLHNNMIYKEIIELIKIKATGSFPPLAGFHLSP